MDGSSRPGKRALHWSRAQAIRRAKPSFSLQKNSSNVFSHAESIYVAPTLCQASAEPFLAHPFLTYPLPPPSVRLLPILSSGHPKFLQAHAFPTIFNVLPYLVCLENSYPDFKTSAHSHFFCKAILEPKGFLCPRPCPSPFCIFLVLYWCCIIQCLPVPTRPGAPWLWELNLVHLWILRAEHRAWHCGYSLNVHWQVKGGSSEKL